jgi:CheY-like chemotaxis protein
MPPKWVLVVEDEPAIRVMVVEWLEKHGLRVTFAEDAAQAYIQARDIKPFLIVSDLVMPAWGTGADFVAKLRGTPHTKDIPVIFMTGLTAEAAKKMVVAEPRVRLLHKPLKWELLGQAIRELTGYDVGADV